MTYPAKFARKSLLWSLAPGLSLVLLLLTACTAHVDRIAAFRNAWHNSQFDRADHEIDLLIAGETGKSVEELDHDAALSETLDTAAGNNVIYALEKGMTLLAKDELPPSAVLWAKAQEYYDGKLGHSFADGFTSIIGDDESRDYVGNDYEHVMLRVMEAFNELLQGGRQAISHALAVDEVQTRIIESDYGTTTGDGERYYPRSGYKRFAIGSYLTGLLYEADIQAREAKKRFERALTWSRFQPQIIKDAIKRTEKGEFAPLGYGALNVIYLAGRGPYYVQGTDQATQTAVSLAKFGIAIVGKSWAAAFQAPVPVPKVMISDSRILPLEVHAPGQKPVRTQIMTDVNMIVAEQLKANMPGIMARAIVRRTAKAAAAAAIERGVRSGNGRNADVAGLFAGIFANIAMTAAERAETRCWTSLPAQIQVARMELPDGVHEIQLSDGNQLSVRIRRGANSWLVVFRPRLDLPGRPLLDVHSRFVPPPAQKRSPSPDAAGAKQQEQ